MAHDEMTRREFVTASTAGALALGAVFIPPAAFGANDRLRLGIVGAGTRGQALMKWAHKLEESHNVQLTAVCDIWMQRRHSAAKKIESWNQKPAAQYRTLDDLCAQDDTDAVLIATADFQHAYHAAKAAQAGKDIYVEKPFGCDFDQIKKAWRIVKASGCVAQMGTQSRGRGVYFGARDFIQSGGLGRITYAEISDCAFQQYWRIKDCESSIKPEDTNWREFLSYLDPEKYPWNPRHYREFRLFWPFSSGCFCQWMSHRIDLVNLALDSIPRCAVAMGGVYLWQDGRTNPDTVQCLLEYPGGTMAAYHMRMGNKANSRGIFLYGTHGMIDLSSGTVSSSGGEGAVLCDNPGATIPQFRIDKSQLIPEKTLFPSPPDVDHLGDFFDCVRRRRQPRADVDAGYAHAVATIMANMAYRTGRRIEYDAEKMELRPKSIA